MILSTCDLPLISVIIPAYNYAAFLNKAISSVLQQTYSNVEILVIDDGSTDDTKSIANNFRTVQYFYQENKGLAAARNAGIKQAKGKYLVFLDADDWLEPKAIEYNLRVIQNKPYIAFVSGNYYFLKAETNILYPVSVSIADHHYRKLLECNYIGMHASIMFQRWVFDEFCYDENLGACEDYDLYLHITRKYPVIHHQEFIATYYFHSSGLSHNYQAMIDSIKAVFKKQAPFVVSAEEKCAYEKGLQQWKDYYRLMQEAVIV